MLDLLDAPAQPDGQRCGASGRASGAGDGVPAGYFLGPLIVALEPETLSLEGVLRARIFREEIFGPVLVVVPFETEDEAIALANATDYGLTAGVFTRSPARARRVAGALRAGNVYVNREITGARVGVEPFGGVWLSGTGPKAGGREYLLRLRPPRTRPRRRPRRERGPPRPPALADAPAPAGAAPVRSPGRRTPLTRAERIARVAVGLTDPVLRAPALALVSRAVRARPGRADAAGAGAAHRHLLGGAARGRTGGGGRHGGAGRPRRLSRRRAPRRQRRRRGHRAGAPGAGRPPGGAPDRRGRPGHGPALARARRGAAADVAAPGTATAPGWRSPSPRPGGPSPSSPGSPPRPSGGAWRRGWGSPGRGSAGSRPCSPRRTARRRTRRASCAASPCPRRWPCAPCATAPTWAPATTDRGGAILAGRTRRRTVARGRPPSPSAVAVRQRLDHAAQRQRGRPMPYLTQVPPARAGGVRPARPGLRHPARAGAAHRATTPPGWRWSRPTWRRCGPPSASWRAPAGRWSGSGRPAKPAPEGGGDRARSAAPAERPRRASTRRKRVLITGAAGRIGSSLAEQLKDRYDLRVHYHRTIPEQPPVDDRLVADISDYDADRAGDGGHRRRRAHGRRSRARGPPGRASASATSSAPTTSSRRPAGPACRKVVFASTNHVMGMYDRDQQWPIYGHQPVRPDSLYGVSKAFGETLGRHYDDQYGLSVICLRIGWFLPQPRDEIGRWMWLSPRDCAQVTWRAIESDLGFGVFYAISAQRRAPLGHHGDDRAARLPSPGRRRGLRRRAGCRLAGSRRDGPGRRRGGAHGPLRGRAATGRWVTSPAPPGSGRATPLRFGWRLPMWDAAGAPLSAWLPGVHENLGAAPRAVRFGLALRPLHPRDGVDAPRAGHPGVLDGDGGLRRRRTRTTTSGRSCSATPTATRPCWPRWRPPCRRSPPGA